MLPEFSLPHRIWRVLYPAIVYILVSNAVAIIGVIGYSVMLALQMMNDIGEIDIFAVADTAMGVLTDKALTFMLFGYLASIVVFVPMWVKTGKLYPRWAGGRPTLRSVLLVVGIGVGLNFLVSVLITLTGLSERFSDYEDIANTLTSGSFLVQILAVGILAPVAEELCFRGITLSRLSGVKLWAAIIIQAALFGIVHLNILQGLYAFAVGIVLGFLCTRFRTLWLPIVLHIVFNTTNILFSQFAGNSETADVIIGFIATASIVLSIVCFVFLLREDKNGANFMDPDGFLTGGREEKRRGPDL
jgi:membrane protease YdiL (CAAX protease family)